MRVSSIRTGFRAIVMGALVAACTIQSTAAAEDDRTAGLPDGVIEFFVVGKPMYVATGLADVTTPDGADAVAAAVLDRIRDAVYGPVIESKLAPADRERLRRDLIDSIVASEGRAAVERYAQRVVTEESQTLAALRADYRADVEPTPGAPGQHRERDKLALAREFPTLETVEARLQELRSEDAIYVAMGIVPPYFEEYLAAATARWGEDAFRVTPAERAMMRATVEQFCRSMYRDRSFDDLVAGAVLTIEISRAAHLLAEHQLKLLREKKIVIMSEPVRTAVERFWQSQSRTASSEGGGAMTVPFEYIGSPAPEDWDALQMLSGAAARPVGEAHFVEWTRSDTGTASAIVAEVRYDQVILHHLVRDGDTWRGVQADSDAVIARRRFFAYPNDTLYEAFRRDSRWIGGDDERAASGRYEMPWWARSARVTAPVLSPNQFRITVHGEALDFGFVSPSALTIEVARLASAGVSNAVVERTARVLAETRLSAQERPSVRARSLSMGTLRTENERALEAIQYHNDTEIYWLRSLRDDYVSGARPIETEDTPYRWNNKVLLSREFATVRDIDARLDALESGNPIEAFRHADQEWYHYAMMAAVALTGDDAFRVDEEVTAQIENEVSNFRGPTSKNPTFEEAVEEREGSFLHRRAFALVAARALELMEHGDVEIQPPLLRDVLRETWVTEGHFAETSGGPVERAMSSPIDWSSVEVAVRGEAVDIEIDGDDPRPDEYAPAIHAALFEPLYERVYGPIIDERLDEDEREEIRRHIVDLHVACNAEAYELWARAVADEETRFLKRLQSYHRSGSWPGLSDAPGPYGFSLRGLDEQFPSAQTVTARLETLRATEPVYVVRGIVPDPEFRAALAAVALEGAETIRVSPVERAAIRQQVEWIRNESQAIGDLEVAAARRVVTIERQRVFAVVAANMKRRLEAGEIEIEPEAVRETMMEFWSDLQAWRTFAPGVPGIED